MEQRRPNYFHEKFSSILRREKIPYREDTELAGKLGWYDFLLDDSVLVDIDYHWTDIDISINKTAIALINGYAVLKIHFEDIDDEESISRLLNISIQFPNGIYLSNVEEYQHFLEALNIEYPEIFEDYIEFDC